jgi:hypothetical protein
MASFDAELSSKEKATLHRIALGTSGLNEFRLDDVKRLTALGLVTSVAGGLYATEAGLTRHHSPPPKQAKPRLNRILPPDRGKPL